MFCERCGKNEANVKYTEIINGDKKEMHLCEKCSQKLGISDINFNMPIDFSSFFGDVISEMDTNFLPIFETEKELKCNKCNTSYKEFLDTGKFGCANCYDAFKYKVDDILKRIHGSNKYIGKSVDNTKENIFKEYEEKETHQTLKQKLERDLKNAISEERYEDAAKLRDELKNLDN